MQKPIYKIGIIVLLILLSYEASAERFFRGSADASAAVALDTERFIMADDEDNILRVYNWNRPGSDPNCQTDISAAIGFDPEHPEADIEGATWLNDRIFWITSHGRNKDGAYRSGRCRFFANRSFTDCFLTFGGRRLFCALLTSPGVDSGRVALGKRACRFSVPPAPCSSAFFGAPARL